MRSLKFKGSYPVGGQQQQYNTLHVMPVLESGEMIMIFELTDEEVAEIVRTKKLVYSQLTGGVSFQPMRILTAWPIEVSQEPPEILPDVNSDPKLN